MKQGAGFERFNLRHLRYFLAVADSGSFRAASANLNIAQSAVSRRIAYLEQTFGVQLFDRHSRGIALSAAGEALRISALRIAREIDNAHAALRAHLLGQHGGLRIGFFGTTSRLGFVPGALTRFRTDQPQIRLELLPVPQGEPDEATLASLDLAIHENKQESAAHRLRRHIHHGQYMLALPRGHRLAALDVIPLAALCNEELILFPHAANPVVHDHLIGEAAKRGRPLNIIHETVSECSRLAFAAAGMGVALVSPLAANHDQGFAVEYRPFGDVRLDFDLWLSARDSVSANAMLFGDMLTTLVASLESLG